MMFFLHKHEQTKRAVLLIAGNRIEEIPEEAFMLARPALAEYKKRIFGPHPDRETIGNIVGAALTSHQLSLDLC